VTVLSGYYYPFVCFVVFHILILGKVCRPTWEGGYRSRWTFLTLWSTLLILASQLTLDALVHFSSLIFMGKSST